ncbi:MAG: hypothetical protein ABSA81_00705 [Candidatus Bathyarchaeia archaeon]|jgi:hypothetical protein
MTEVTRESVTEAEESKYWRYALIILIIVSSFFLVLRFSGRALTVVEFEILVIYLPTLVSALVYANTIRHMIQR